MINHARTLLLNSKQTTVASLPGAQYVPTDFVPVSLNIPLTTIRRVLFGPNPDAFKLVYRTQELLTLLHASELSDFLYTLDSRITYWPFDNSLFYMPTEITSKILSGDTTLVLGGGPPVEDAGALYYAWNITASDGQTLEIQQTAPRQRLMTAELTFVDGLSLPVVIPGTATTIHLPPPSPGDSWRLSGAVRPSYDLAAIYAQILQLPQEIINWLFRDQQDSFTQRFQTFWSQGSAACRFNGFLCATIWQMELRRRAT